MKQHCIILFLLHLALFGFSQERTTNELDYEVNLIYPPLSITKETLTKAHSIADLNKHYKPEWIREYISVEVLTRYQGSMKTAKGINDTLSLEQKEIMKMADVGTEIEIKVLYIPENTLADNDIKTFDFAFMVNPEFEATFKGGQGQLKRYLKNKAIDKISKGVFEGYTLATVKFTIDEEGLINNPHIYWSCENEKVDNLLLEAVQDMPNWKPAEYANGVKTKQEFALTVGNHENCSIHLLNIRQD